MQNKAQYHWHEHPACREDRQLDNKKYIKIRGAAEHNLKNIDIDIPRDEFVVLTGLSGSGKSSLAFDSIYLLMQDNS